MKEFEHGGQIELFAQELSCPIEEIIDLSSNINFIKPNIGVDFNHLNISSYPTYHKLYEAIAQNYGINTQQLELYNGGSSAIFALFRQLSLQTCTIYSPAYLEYKKAAKNFGYKLELINRFNAFDTGITPQSLVIFVNPSTPDGKFYEIEILLQYWKSQDATVLIDESFLDFTQKSSAIEYLNKYDNVYILKSMTKFYSSAGIRVGTLVSNEKNIQALRKNEPQWKLSQFDSIYLQEALKDKSFKSISKSLNAKNNILLENVLRASPLFERVYSSSANYMLVQLKSMSAQMFQEQLKPYKIMVRNCANFDFLDKSCVRIAVKSQKDIEALETALKQIEL
ncbi:MAG: aminotransferase class I/II-fold pyridoxal phosphate-dependent enzyme [Candidatus Marinarcus sp.]|uniref:aminotransferase class I/II-fold pyridoxal phosphate-dependent enzyme n=1 Tax=Candidatus Marinarcus sp. TaxID=3100987 RepID=UPI003B000EE7